MRKIAKIHPLRAIREILGKSRPQFGALVGCTQHAIKRIENGRLKLSNKLAMRVMQATGANWCELTKGPDGRAIDFRGVPYTRDCFQRWTQHLTGDRQRVLVVGRDHKWHPVTLDLKQRRQKEISDLLKWAELVLNAADEKAKLPQVKQSLVDWMREARAEFKLEEPIDRELRHRTFRETVSFKVADLRKCKQFARLYDFKDKGQPDEQVVTLTQTFWSVWCPGATAPPESAVPIPKTR